MIRLTVPNIGADECRAVERVLRSGQLVHGEECNLFEKELAEYLGAKEVIVVSSCTAALHLSLIALGIGPGDAVLVPDFTFPATVNVVELVGARPIFLDVDLRSYVITPEIIEQAILDWEGPEKIKAIIPVHEFGYPVNMSAVMELAKKYNLLVIEDAACALGADHKGRKVGTYGNTGCFSFHPRKALTTGEGGAIATNDFELAHKLRLWRNHGIESSPMGNNFLLPGFNYRMTNFQAALGRVQLEKFSECLKERRLLQQIYQKELQNTVLHTPQDEEGHSWQTYMVVLPNIYDRDRMIKELKLKGIETNLGAQAIHIQIYYQQKYSIELSKLKDCNAEKLFYRGLALPLYQGLSEEDVILVVQQLKQIL